MEEEEFIMEKELCKRLVINVCFCSPRPTTRPISTPIKCKLSPSFTRVYVFDWDVSDRAIRTAPGISGRRMAVAEVNGGQEAESTGQTNKNHLRMSGK